MTPPKRWWGVRHLRWLISADHKVASDNFDKYIQMHLAADAARIRLGPHSEACAFYQNSYYAQNRLENIWTGVA
mgnify:CR=1 FL=1